MPPFARAVAVLLTFLATLGGLAACSSGTAAVTNVAASDAADVLARPDVTVIDVRTSAEFASGHLADAVNLDIEGSTFDHELEALPRDDTYVVYCHSGNRSGVATDAMASLGFTKVFDLQGGITQWQSSGGAIVTS